MKKHSPFTLLLKTLCFRYACFFFPDALRKVCYQSLYIAKASRWVRDHSSVPRFSTRSEYFRHIIESESLDAPIDFLEFGVYRGHSLKYWVGEIKHPDARFVGFDCFEGLPEHWGLSHPSGTFSTEGKLPDIDDDRCRFEVGLFHETLPQFLQKWDFSRRKVIHMDADLYSSSLYVLTMLWPHLQSRDILLFDDFVSMRHAVHEFRAFEDFSSAYPISIEVLGIIDARVATKIVSV